MEMIDPSPRSDRTEAEKTEKFVVRLPRGIRGLISDVSRANHRSMNSEIVARLEESLGLSTPPAEAVAEGTPELYAVDCREGATDGHMEALLLERFRRLSPDRRQALLNLLR